MAVYSDGSIKAISDLYTSLEEALAELPGTQQARALRIPSASLVRVLTRDRGVVALDAATWHGTALPEPPGGWARALAVVGSDDLQPLVLPGPLLASRSEAEDLAYATLTEAIVEAAHDGLPGRGLLREIRRRVVGKGRLPFF